MSRLKFPLSSDQLELLLAFESNDSLGRLSESMCKDPSVVSRNLQRLAEDLPVLAKIKGRWQLTPLGRQVNELTKDHLNHLSDLLFQSRPSSLKLQKPYLSDRALLLIINAQMGLLDPSLGDRNNQSAENNIHKLLLSWRKQKKPIIHVKHVSDNPASTFYLRSTGTQFIPLLMPAESEPVIEKKKSSAFHGTSLADDLQANGIDTLIITGFTANECIDATAKQASDLGFTTYVIGDATAMFDISGPDGKLYKAERVHRLTLANLHALFAKVLDTETLLKDLTNDS
jgi:nicotinamidase-related amidase